MQKSDRIFPIKFFDLNRHLDGYGGFAFHSVDSYLHQHVDFYEIIAVTHGTIFHRYNGKTEIADRGTCMLLSPGSLHRLSCQPMEAVHFVCCIHKDFFLRFMQRHFPDTAVEALPPMLQYKIGEDALRYLEYLANLLCCSAHDRQVADTLTYLVLSELLYRFGPTDSSDQEYYVDEIISLLNNPIYLSQTVEELCANFPVSRPTILKNFKKRTGVSIVEYKAQRKLEYAAYSLAENDMSVTDISGNLGYDSLSYFLRAFKKKYGITPTEYRKQHQK